MARGTRASSVGDDGSCSDSPAADASPNSTGTNPTNQGPISVDTPPPSPPVAGHTSSPKGGGGGGRRKLIFSRNKSNGIGDNGSNGDGGGGSSSSLTSGPPQSMPLTPSTPTSSNQGPDVVHHDSSPSQQQQKQQHSHHSPKTPQTSHLPRHSPRSAASGGGGGGGPHTPRSAASRKRRTVSTAKSTVGVENNVRRLVEYFVVVSSLRRKRPGQRGRTASSSSSGDGGGVDAGNGGNGDAHGGDQLQKQQQPNGDGEECPPSPPAAVPGMMASGSPRHSPRISPRPGRKLSDTACHNQSPKVQQRINFRRIHLPQQGSDDSDDGGGGDSDHQATTAGALSPHDIGDEGTSNASIEGDGGRAQSLASSSPAGGDGRKKPARPLSRSRLFKGSKVRSFAAAMGEGQPPLRLPVLDHSERESLTSEGESTFDESDDEDVGGDEGNIGRGRGSGGDAATRVANGEINFGKAAPLPDLDDPIPRNNGEDAAVGSSSQVERPPLHPTASQRTARWQREGGASTNIRMPGAGADVGDDGHDGYAGNVAMGESSVGGGAELCFEPLVTSRYPLEDYADNELNELAVAQFCNPSSDVIELTTEYCMPRVHHFVLTNEKGRKIYGTCLTIYEEFEPPDDGRDLTPEELELLEWYRSHAGTVQYAEDDGVEVTFHRNAGRATLYLPRMLCLLSTWPYLTAFREYLTQLYRIATTTDQMTAPLERYILNICKEVPAPPPGAFELRMDILDSAIRFWAPPAQQPIAYVALPFEILFECLDISNVLFVWYSLTLERKVLLVSSQCSILTVCAEIICSLLFPMQWSHLYVPTIPRFLTPMLDAPMPYLCGITRENLFYAVGDVSDETIVVDLDQNVITAGPYTPDLPPIPHRRRHKLETALEQHVGEVFWNARGLHKHEVDKVKNSKKSDANERLEDVLDGAELTWSLRLKGFDEAFNLAYAPDSYNNLNDSPLPSNLSMCQQEDETTDVQSQYDAVQEAFLRFFVAALKGYRRFLTVEDAPDDEGIGAPSSLSNRTGRPTFRSEDFVASKKSEFQPFLQEFVMTQQFDDFITKRMYSPGEPDVTFFDQSIDEKNNRSKLKLNKTETPFLQSTKSHKALKAVYAVEPNAHDLPDENNGIEWSLSTIYSPTAQQKKRFVYSAWPEKLKPELFGSSRPIPEMINAEFDRQAAIVAKIRSNYIDEDEENQNWDLYASECDPSPEIASFTVFFLLYCAAIGRELEAIEDKRKKLNLDRTIYEISTSSPKSEAVGTAAVIKQITSKEGNTDGREEGPSSFIPDCPADVCCALSDLPNYKDVLASFSLMMKFDGDQEVEEVIVREEPTQKEEARRKKFDRFDQVALFAAELEEARATTNAQLNLAFDVLGMMGARLLLADPDVYKYMMEACGRCGDAERATQLMEVVQEEGLVADSEMYSCFVRAFASLPGQPSYLSDDAKQLQPQQRQQQHQLSRRHMTSSSSIPFLLPMHSNSITRKRSTEQTRQDFINSVNLALSMSTEGSTKSGSGGSCSDDTETPLLGVEANYSSSAASGKELRESVAMKKKRSRNKSVTSVDPDTTIVTDPVAMHVTLAESLLSLLYPNVSIDTDSDSCPKCSRVLTEDDITAGWVPCAFKDYTTGCPQCHHRFVPSFAVFCSSPTFVGSQGKGTPLYCERLSPWVLRKEIHNILRQYDGIDVILQPGWRSESDINATLWWNLIVCFNRYKLPLSFLLQGSFKNRLILPAL